MDKTRINVKYGDSLPCGIPCALARRLRHGENVNTEYMVTTSDQVGTSYVEFSDLDEARQYANEHGGTLYRKNGSGHWVAVPEEQKP